MVLKMADIGHLMAAEDVHMKWVEGLTEEFFAQGDDEKRQGLPVSFLMDRDKPGVSSSQVGFFDFVVLPLFRAWVAVFPKSQPMLTLIVRLRVYDRAPILYSLPPHCSLALCLVIASASPPVTHTSFLPRRPAPYPRFAISRTRAPHSHSPRANALSVQLSR